MDQDNYIVVGTAGHVDHGKTLLTAALTGIDTDRLPEEKRRGMTIVPGFVPLDLKSGRRLGLIDVPGHEKFVKNMLAGVAGIDMVMLVVAANEGVMPQTLEHLNILELLGIDKGVAVITKADLVDERTLAAARRELAQLLKPTSLKNAPILAVSAVTGQNIDELREVLDAVAAKLEGKSASGFCRLPVDRVFTKAGFGTVVTGTLWTGQIKNGQKLQLIPQNCEVRVRGLQVHGHPVEEAKAGQRTAVNLSGADADKITCGGWLAQPGMLKKSYRIDVCLTLLASAKPLSHHARVRVHHGTAEVLARVNLLDREELEAGQNCFAQLVMETPLPPLKGDRLIVRSYSPVHTIGGASVLNPLPQRHKRFDEAVITQLSQKGAQDQKETVADMLKQASKPLSATEIGQNVQVAIAEVEQCLTLLKKENRILQIRPDSEAYYLLTEQKDKLQQACLGILGEYHQKYPLRKGIPLAQLRQNIFPFYSVKQINVLLEQWQKEGRLLVDGATVISAGFSRRPTPQQEQALARILQAYEKSKFSPPEWDVLIKELSLKREEASEYLLLLTENGKLIKTGDIYYCMSALIEAEALLREHFFKHDFTIGQARDALGTSRRYAQTILDYLDNQKITVRVGDTRHFLK